MSTASKAVASKNQGVAKVVRKSCAGDGSVGQHTFASPKIDWLTVYNASDVDIKYNFNDQDATLTTHYRTLTPGMESRRIGVTKDMTMEFAKVLTAGGVKRIELTLWG